MAGKIIKGRFSVSLQPENSYAQGLGGVTLARLTFDKTFTGALVANSQGSIPRDFRLSSQQCSVVAENA